MIQKYHVYILGAGASSHAGLPVLSDFFHKAEALCEGNKARQPACNGYQAAIELIRRYRADNRKNCQPQNIEDVYRLALESNNAEVLNALEKVILGVLDLHGCLVNYDGKEYKPNGVYKSFVEKLFPHGDSPRTRRENIDNTVIITFNWDCLLDYALFYHNIEPYYGVSQYSKTNTPKLFKMHGSLNWGICRACGSNIQPIPPQDFVGLRCVREPVEFDLRIVTEGWSKKKCRCGRALSPKIVPPTHTKELNKEMRAIWQKAGEVLESAFKITIIGYSFPKTDLDFLKLIDKALEKNIDLRCIENVDPENTKTSFQKNYKNRFNKHQDKMEFLTALPKFENYVSAL